jgi:hypothetical protein
MYIYIDSYHLKISEDPIFFQGFRNNRSRVDIFDQGADGAVSL